MQVVCAVERIEVQRALAFDEPAVGLHGSQVRHDRAAVVTAQHVDVAGHVLQVAGVGHQAAQQVGRGQRVFGVRRHLHGVQVEVQHAGMLRGPPAVASAASRIRLASTTREPGAGSPVLVSHNAHAVTLTSASAASAWTSMSSG